MSQITRWNPLREMAAMRQTMDHMFDESLRSLWQNEGMNWGTLALDMDEDDKHFIIKTDLPGVNSDDIHVQIDGDMLSIEAEITQEHETENRRSIIKERRYGKVSRRVRLPGAVDQDQVEADYADGVLTLRLPRTEAEQPKRIAVKSAK